MKNSLSAIHLGLFSRRGAICAAALMATHAGLLAYSGGCHSPTVDEIAHLPAGIRVWQTGKCDLYSVNPPLVKIIASAPVVGLAAPKTKWRISEGIGYRPEWSVGTQFVEQNGSHVFRMFAMARLACIPFSVLGAYYCYAWAKSLFGASAGLVALTLWCFCPNIIGHGSLITPDVPAAATGIAAVYAFWRWLAEPNWSRTLLSALTTGLAILTKATWLALFPLSILLFFIHSARSGWNGMCRRLWRFTIIAVASVLVINLGYAFEGSFTRLGDYLFASEMLAGSGETVGNRFKDTPLEGLPIPLPSSFIAGMDLQQRDFETGIFGSYLRGEWRQHGWWYYYLYALAIKVPLGTWAVLGLAILCSVISSSYRSEFQNEAALILPALFVLLVVSFKTGMTDHFRYVLPGLPFLFVVASRVGRAFDVGHRAIATIVACAVAWSVTSSAWVYPHSLSYFNESVGGPLRGHWHLLSSNIDWHQDLLFLRDWMEKNPEARPLYYVYRGMVDPRTMGLDLRKVPSRPARGWYAVSVNMLHDRAGRFAYLNTISPVTRIGYSIYVFHLTDEQATKLWKNET